MRKNVAVGHILPHLVERHTGCSRFAAAHVLRRNGLFLQADLSETQCKLLKPPCVVNTVPLGVICAFPKHR